ncbi:acetyl-CoA acetyltransferase [Candidatus Wirthbacteria bacterium CG2_30_54_11]|uniref:Acetyl-CoA acetyltransferase n=1 Tax=Candidatus Wirthbacteria bacterium CG2_30_54_11 TaxID=1817892 RepID=A0A1J5ITT4_9BACT|nr:MAG: acetyl-CoA acetyltransferase [Candidatus Wirthbacteria bacterium CG2_30_54_11]
MKPVVITSAVRTAIGRIGGALKDVQPEVFLKPVITEALVRSGVNGAMVDEVVIGQAKQSTEAPNIARVASLLAGLPDSVPAYTVHRQCSSGLQVILNAVFQIQAGYADIMLAGGVESMSTAPYYLRGARFGYGAGNALLLDPNTESQPRSQPESVYGTLSMGETAETLAEQYHITREEQDAFAFQSQQRTLAAQDSGCFADEIVPIEVKQGREICVFDRDEHPRKDTTLEKLAKLKPAFKKDGTVTAGNSSGRNDGAAAVLIMTEERASALGLKPLVRFVSAGIAGVDPRTMGIGPVPATHKALKRAGLTLADIDLIELNEAFAAQSLAVIKELDLPQEKVNVNGGAIALGHPLGCSGTRIAVTLIHEMMERGSQRGLATICVAGGLGVTVIFEKV